MLRRVVCLDAAHDHMRGVQVESSACANWVQGCRCTKCSLGPAGVPGGDSVVFLAQELEYGHGRCCAFGPRVYAWVSVRMRRFSFGHDVHKWRCSVKCYCWAGHVVCVFFLVRKLQEVSPWCSVSGGVLVCGVEPGTTCTQRIQCMPLFLPWGGEPVRASRLLGTSLINIFS